jgi:acyl-CoA synthetase (AMP-forming)/AMP-acid ligase II
VSGSPAGWLLPDADADVGDRTAVIEAGSGTTLTYRELAGRIDARSDALAACAGNVVLFGITNSIDDVVDYLALTGLGAAVLLADPEAPAEAVEAWVAAYRPEVVRGFAHHGPVDAASPAPARTEAVLLPTSGSTGSPKFVRLTRRNLRANAEQIVEALRIRPGDRAFAHLPLFYSFGLSVLHSHLVAGATVVLSTSSAIRPEFWDELAAYAVTSLPGVPYSYEMFRRMRLAERDLPALRELTQAGGRMSPERILEFHEAMAVRGGRLWVMYGQTEASARISVLPPEELPARVGSVGRALPGSRVRVADAGADGTGELIVEGPQVMLGYAEGRVDLDGSDRCGGVLATGDVGRVDAEGWITITGRLKRMAKVFGTRVNLDDVERRLAPFGHLAAVDDGDGIAVFVEVSETGEVPGDLARRMERHLAFPARSIRLRPVSVLPTTAAGKIDYQELRSACR